MTAGPTLGALVRTFAEHVTVSADHLRQTFVAPLQAIGALPKVDTAPVTTMQAAALVLAYTAGPLTGDAWRAALMFGELIASDVEELGDLKSLRSVRTVPVVPDPMSPLATSLAFIISAEIRRAAGPQTEALPGWGADHIAMGRDASGPWALMTWRAGGLPMAVHFRSAGGAPIAPPIPLLAGIRGSIIDKLGSLFEPAADMAIPAWMLEALAERAALRGEDLGRAA